MNVRLPVLLSIVTMVLTPACASPGGEPAGPHAEESARADHHFCGWLYGSNDDPAFTEQAYATFAEHADELDAVHPTWWQVGSPTSFINHAPGSTVPFAGFHDPRVLARTTPGGGRTKLIPLIGAVHPPQNEYVHVMINDPELRRRHAQALAALATENGYDGLDLDYEHLDPEHLPEGLGPGRTRETERAAFSAFFVEAAREMHAAGKTLSLAVPVISDMFEPAYDYDVLSREADAVHVMNYDFHYEEGAHGGPLAPLGWVEENLDLIQGIDGGRRAGKFLLGLPNYGLIGPDEGRDGQGVVRACQPSSACRGLFQGAYEETTAHMSRCTAAGGPRYAAGRAPNVALAGGERLFFEDLASLDERVAAGARHGLGGVTYWSIGGEPGGDAFFAMIRERYPPCAP